MTIQEQEKTTTSLPLKLDLQYFAEGGNGEPGAGEPQNSEGNTQPEGQTQDPQSTQGGAANHQNPEPKKLELTQEEIDRIVADRLAREKKKYSDYEELQKFKSEAEKRAEDERLAKLDEIEREREEKAKAEQKAQELENQLLELQEKAKKQSITNEFIKYANAKNIAHIDDALILAQTELNNIAVDENGMAVGVDAIVDSLVKNKPFLLKSKPEPKEIGGPTGGEPNDEVKTVEAQLEEAKAKKDFNLVVELSNKLSSIKNKK